MSNYDNWKTTDPADEHMRAIVPKSTRLQCAADDAYVIAETIEAAVSLLNRFHAEHGEDLPGHDDLVLIARKITEIAHSLEPVED